MWDFDDKDVAMIVAGLIGLGALVVLGPEGKDLAAIAVSGVLALATGKDKKKSKAVGGL